MIAYQQLCKPFGSLEQKYLTSISHAHLFAVAFNAWKAWYLPEPPTKCVRQKVFEAKICVLALSSFLYLRECWLKCMALSHDECTAVIIIAQAHVILIFLDAAIVRITMHHTF